MDVTTVALPAAAADPAWPVLLDQDPWASAFQSPAWLATWAACRATGPVLVRQFRRDGALVGLVGEMEVDATTRTIAGGRDVTDYRGPIVVSDALPEVTDAWLAALDSDGVTEMLLHGIPTDSGVLDSLAKVCEDAPWALVDREIEDVCPCVDLEGDAPESWLDRLDGKERHELRRKSRKLARDLGGMSVQQVQPDALGSGLERFWAMAMTADADKGAFFRDDEMRLFFDQVVETMGADGTLRIDELLVGGLPAASMISVVHGDRWGLYNSALDEALAGYAPGTVLAAELATQAAAAGHRVFDFLRGDEAYKYRFGAIDRPIESARLVRS